MTPDSNNQPDNASFAFGEAKMQRLLELGRKRSPKAIPEFGSGLTTARFCEEFPNATIVSVDNSPLYLEQTRSLCKSIKGPRATPRLLISALRWQSFSHRAFRSYDLASIAKELDSTRFDLCLIDGPVQNHTLGGREFILYRIFEYLNTGALIALDDYHRSDSKRCLENWMRIFGNTIRVVAQDSSVVFLEKTNQPKEIASLGGKGWIAHHRKVFKALLKSFNKRRIS